MKRCILLVLFAAYSLIAYSQEAKVISKFPQKVPIGKKWILTSASKPLIEISGAAFISGNICNANINSSPRVIGNIMEIEVGRGNPRPVRSVSIAFSNLTKIAFTNDRTYQISDIITYAVYGSDDSKKTLNEVVFLGGQTVMTTGCLESIEVLEVSISQSNVHKVISKSSTEIKLENNSNKKAKYVYGGDIEENWVDFFKEFKRAVEVKDISKLRQLTVSDFYDGGGGYTLEEWLNEIVFVDSVRHDMFMQELSGKTIMRNLDNGDIDRVTGSGEAGRLYFVYENSDWKFGGVIGD